ncbi:MAG: Ig-like domain-containing protein [Kofleriaceae bacterium]
MKRSLGIQSVALATVVAFVATSCGPRATTTTKPGGTVATPGGQPLEVTDQPGLTMRLSDGKAGAPAADRSTLPPTTPLDAAAAKALLDRVAPIGARPDDAAAFALRDRSQPPPRTGKTIAGTFPVPNPQAGPPPATNDAGKPLTVVRWAPEGDVAVAPQLQVTFSQAMVAVTSQADAAATVPVTLLPTPPGAWRWLGTKTLLFDPTVRFPQATTYQVEIPQGTRSATGNALAAAVRFTFTTPTPRIEASWPTSGPQALDVPMFVKFDQRIDPAAVLATVAVKAGGRTYATRQATAAEIEANATVKGLVDAAKAAEQDGRWLAFVATERFPKDTRVEVTVGPGTPSAEGPNRTADVQRFSFETYPPLKVVKAECGWGECPPGAPFQIEFNNPLDEARFDGAQVTTSPAIPRVATTASGNYLTVQGLTEARTAYTTTVSGGVVDSFGQTLGKDATFTWKTGKARPTFYGPSGLVVLDPGAKRPTLDVFSTTYDGLKVQLYAVTPADYRAFGVYLQNQWQRKQPSLPGRKVFDQLVPVKDAGTLTETAIDLAPALTKGLGQVIAVVEPSPWKERYDPPRLVTWIQSTRLGVDAAVDAGELHAWVNRLADGAPVAGARLTLAPWGTTGTTAADGTAVLGLSAAPAKGAGMLIATAGDDVAFVPDGYGWWNDEPQWRKQTPADELVWHLADDRQMYRPGEEVHLKGWLRVRQDREGGDVAGLGGLVSSVTYVVTDPVGNDLTKGTAALSALGGFDVAFTLPKTPNLGTASIRFEAAGRLSGSAWHGFQIQEFRRPEYEVTAKADDAIKMIGGSGDITVTASYFAGGGLAGAEVDWNLTASETTFTPPNRDDFTFGTWVPWWGWGRRWWDDGGGWKPPQTWQHHGTTDAAGAHVLHLDFVGVNPPTPMTVTANASVTDVNRQAWNASTTLLVHPAAHYVGLRTTRPYVDRGQPIEVEAIDVDLDGAAVVGRAIELTAVRLDYQYTKGTYVETEEDLQTCTLTSAAAVGRCAFTTAEGGQYRITGVVTDERGRNNRTELTVWVSGGKTPPARDVEQEQVTLIPNAKTYRPGDTAELLIQAPFYPAEGVLSVRRSGIVASSRFTMTGPTQTVKVPITDGYTPNLWVQVELVGMTARVGDDGQPDAALPKRPAYGVGTINLPVPPVNRTLAVTIKPRAAKVAPGAKTGFDVTVRDAAGQPVSGAEVAVIAVDEAVLSLTGYQFGNPLDTFYTERGAGASDHRLREFVKLARPGTDQLAETEAGGDGARSAGVSFSGSSSLEQAYVVDGINGPAPKKPAPSAAVRSLEDGNTATAATTTGPIAVRTNMNPLAAFSPKVMTRADGTAAVEVTIPDNLTRYRLIALAVAGERQFGKGESALTARLPIMVRPSPPRFLNFGDRFELPVVIQNQTDAALAVDVAVRATNATLTRGNGQRVTVPANDRVEVRFPAAAALAGTARFQLAASASAGADAAEVALPVWTPATTEAFATYGQIDSGAIRQPVALPGQVVTQFGGLQVETSSTQLQALTDAFLYLVSYPFECAEQISSRVAGIADLRDVLDAFKAPGLPGKAKLEAKVAEDLERLYALQNGDGGFPFWQRGYDSWPYLTVHVTNAMIRAKAKGFAVEAGALREALGYLKTIERRYPSYYGPEIRRTITAYALYTRTLAGDRDVARAKGLIAEAGGVDKLPLEAVGWLLGVVAQQPAAAAERAAIMRHLGNQATETAAAANFTTSVSDGAYLILHSDRRVDAVVLESLIAEDRGNDLIPKLVVGLLGHAKAGRWESTQENVFVLGALDTYFHEYEKVTPDFVAKIWLGDGYAGDHPFKGRQTDRFAVDIPMATVAAKAAAGPADLVIQKDGAGRLYYRVGMTYAPANLRLAAADYGFAVNRRYEAVDAPGDVVRNPDGSWKIKAGARVRVRLGMVAESRRYHVALVDPLPAGLEPMNPALAVTGPIPQDPAATKTDRYWWWSRTWYEHQNLRDERVEAFTSLLWEGVHEYTYVARATTPGTFVVPPTKAEEMYHPETFGRSASDTVVVE